MVNDCTERKLLGIITDRDICIKAVATGKLTGAMKVSEVMSKATVTVVRMSRLKLVKTRWSETRSGAFP